MSKYNAIKTATNAYIKANGRREISGPILNAILNALIDSLGKYYQFVGLAKPSTNPGTPDQNVAYVAITAGTYTNFGGAVVGDGELTLLTYDGEWHKQMVRVVPDKTSQLSNDTGFITNAVNDLVNYYTKTNTYNKDEVDQLIGAIKQFRFETVDTLPTASASTMYIIYLVPSSDPATSDVKDEWITIESGGVYSWEKIGRTTIDLSNYPTKSEMNTAIDLALSTYINGVDATIDANIGTPAVDISFSNGTIHFAFHNLKGAQGNTGSSVDYPYELVNNLTTNDATKGLSAAQGVQLKSEIDQLDLKVSQKARELTIVGNGNTGVYESLSGLESGHKYRVWIDSWAVNNLTQSWSNLSFYVRYDNNGSYEYLYTLPVPITIPSFVDVTLPSGVTEIEIGGRINSGNTGFVRLEDITSVQKGIVYQQKYFSLVKDRRIKTNSVSVTYTSSDTNGTYCCFIPVKEGEQYKIIGVGENNNDNRLYAFYNEENGVFVRVLRFGTSGDFRSSPRYVVIPSGVSHLAVNLYGYNGDTDGVWLLENKQFTPYFQIAGNGNQRSYVNISKYLIPGHTYRILLEKLEPPSFISDNNTVFGVYVDVSGVRFSDKVTIAPSPISKYYDFSVDTDFDFTSHTIDVVVRSNFGTLASFFLEDITELGKSVFPLSGVGGSMATFMDAVQRKSDNIGLTSSTWNNPYGGRLYGFNRTTVRDLMKATIYASGSPRLMDIMGAVSTKVKVWGEHEREVIIANDIPSQLATYYQTLHGTEMPYKILANKAGAHANEENLADNGFSLLVVAIVSGHYVVGVVGIGNTNQGYTAGRNNRKKGMVELLDIVSAYYAGQDITGMAVTSCEKAIAAELPSVSFPQCYRLDTIPTIHAQDADTVFMPASTSKVMAAITMVDFLAMDEFYRISDNVDELVNDSDYTAYAGDVQTVETSFYAMLMASNGANTLSLARIAGEKILQNSTFLV